MNDPSTSLYTDWLAALPKAFQALVPGATASAAAPAASAFANPAMPFPADQIGKAIEGLDGILTQLYQGYLPLLANGELSAKPLQALADSATTAFETLLATLTAPGATLPALPALPDWAKGLMPSAGAGSAQLQLGIERTFGGLGDAFGLRPSRDLEQALREMLAASAAKQRAQAEYLALVAKAWSTGTKGLVKELQALGARGERVESLLAFIRLWAKAIDAPLHETMQGERGLEITAKVIRASTQHRRQVQKAVGLVSEALNMPTRADMDDAFREIQELKRELRRLKKPAPPVAAKKPTAARRTRA